MSMTQEEVVDRLRAAFPAGLRGAVDRVLPIIPRDRIMEQHGPKGDDIGTIIINGEAVHIPSRIYSEEPSSEEVDSLDEIGRLILACIYTRHHNGHVREKYVARLFPAAAEWVPPFVIQLMGE